MHRAKAATVATCVVAGFTIYALFAIGLFSATREWPILPGRQEPKDINSVVQDDSSGMTSREMQTRVSILVMQNISFISALCILGHFLYKYIRRERHFTFVQIMFFYMTIADFLVAVISAFNSVYSANYIKSKNISCDLIGAFTTFSFTYQTLLTVAYIVLGGLSRGYGKSFNLGRGHYRVPLITGIVAAIGTFTWIPVNVYGNMEGLWCYININKGSASLIALICNGITCIIAAGLLLPFTFVWRKDRQLITDWLATRKPTETKIDSMILHSPKSSLQPKRNIARDLDDELMLPEEVMMDKFNVTTQGDWIIFTSRARDQDDMISHDKECYTDIARRQPGDNNEWKLALIQALYSCVVLFFAAIMFFSMVVKVPTSPVLAVIVAVGVGLSGIVRLCAYVIPI